MKSKTAYTQMTGVRKILRVSWIAKKTNEWVLNKAAVGVTVRHCQSKKASLLLRSHHEETRGVEWRKR